MSIEPTPFVSMEVVGVRIEMPSNQPIVLLKEVGGDTFIPIWVGAAEATAIAFAQQGINHLATTHQRRCRSSDLGPTFRCHRSRSSQQEQYRGLARAA